MKSGFFYNPEVKVVARKLQESCLQNTQSQQLYILLI